MEPSDCIAEMDFASCPPTSLTFMISVFLIAACRFATDLTYPNVDIKGFYDNYGSIGNLALDMSKYPRVDIWKRAVDLDTISADDEYIGFFDSSVPNSNDSWAVQKSFKGCFQIYSPRRCLYLEADKDGLTKAGWACFVNGPVSVPTLDVTKFDDFCSFELTIKDPGLCPDSMCRTSAEMFEYCAYYYKIGSDVSCALCNLKSYIGP